MGSYFGKSVEERKLNIIFTPSVCLPLSDGRYCLIPPEFITRKRTADDAKVFHETNPCDKGVIGKLCGDDTECIVSQPSGFKCKCKEGYFQITTYVPAQNVLVDICEDIDECLNPTICPNTTTCFNLPGDYTCKCKDGYRLQEGKSVKYSGCTAVCSPNPCVHGTCSETGSDGFSCNCEGSYIGRLCNQQNDAVEDIKKRGNETSGIVGGSLGLFLIVVIIACIILFQRLQKHKQDARKLASLMERIDQQAGYDNIVLSENAGRTNSGDEYHNYNNQYPIDNASNSRPHLGRSIDRNSYGGGNRLERCESGDYRRGYTDDDQMFADAHSSRHSGEEIKRSSERDDRFEQSRRPLSRSSDHLGNENSGKSRMQYENRGYEEDNRMFPKAHSSRHSGKQSHQSGERVYRHEHPRRPLSRSSDYLDNEKIGESKMQYRNRGYEEDDQN